MSSDPAPGGRAIKGEEARAELRSQAPTGFGRCNVLLLSLVVACVIGFSLWLSSSGRHYREAYAQTTEGSLVGSTREVELTLVREDKRNLACASDETVAGLRCGYRQNSQPVGSTSSDDPHLLQPFNTVRNELLLGAGLWSSFSSKEPLPHGRFTVICNYHVKGGLKSPSVRFDSTAAFGVVQRTVTLGSLTDCAFPL